MKVKSVFYNFHQTGSLDMGMDGDGDYAEVNRLQTKGQTPIEIIEHIPSNGLQRHYVDVIYGSGTVKRIFNIAEINYYSPSELEAFIAEQSKATVCPNCGSKSTYDRESMPPTHRCNDCNNSWQTL